MFNNLSVIAPTQRSIALQTHRGSDIKNLIELPPGEQEHAKNRRLRLKYGQQWVVRKPAVGVYNCVGHVWASRRTTVTHDLESTVMMIFKDDGYRIIDGYKEALMVGDLVTYWESVGRHENFYHVGIISELKPIVGSNVGNGRLPGNIPWVISKWDSTSEEVLHHYKQVPFPYLDHIPLLERGLHEPECQFWTDRPLLMHGMTKP